MIPGSGATNSPSVSDAATQPGRDLELVEAMLRRDRKATAEFVERYADAVYGDAKHRLLPRGEAVEDVVQEVFLTAWQRLPSYRGSGSLEAWLLGIARHKIEDYYRQRLQEPLSLPEDDRLTDSQAECELNGLLDRGRLHERTRRTLAALPEAYGVALLWRYWEKRSTAEMAALSGKSEKAIERLLARARAHFRRRWNID